MKPILTIFLVSIWLLLTGSPVVAGAPVIYVDQAAITGANDGTSWNNAFTDLQLALAAAQAGDQIWVARGVYVPGSNQADSFNLVDGVALYGGFDGTESDLDERDWIINKSVLSGDLAGDDITDENGITSSYEGIVGVNASLVVHALSVSAETILDGVTVSGGYGVPTMTEGGGLINAGSDTTIMNVDLIGNASLHLSNGGGMTNSSGSPTITNAYFAHNLGEFGGAMINRIGEPLIVGSMFFDNRSEIGGGAVFNFNGSPTIDQSTFISNTTRIQPGGDGAGGAILNWLSTPLITNSIFAGNQAQRCGAIHSDEESETELFNSLLVGNFSFEHGGALCNESGSTKIVNGTFSGNRAVGEGGAIRNSSAGDLELLNSVIWDNRDVNGTDSPSSSIRNINGTSYVQHSLVHNSGGSANWVVTIGTDGGFNIDLDPAFREAIAPEMAPFTGGDFELLSHSAAINVGSNALNPLMTDLAGKERIIDTVIDMGAYEYLPFPVQLFLPLISSP